jgi:hypothetical protein
MMTAVMKLVLGLICAATAAAAAAPKLPAKLPLASEATQQARAAEFRRRNPQAWERVVVDHHGFVSQVLTHDRALTTATPAKLEAFLRANADLFGIDPDDARHLRDGFVWDAKVIGSTALGQIGVQQMRDELVIDVMFHVDAEPILDEAALAGRIVGQRYTDTIGYAAPPQRDCAMTPRGAAGCETPIEHTRTREIAIGKRDIRTATLLYADGDTLRLVGCVDASWLDSPRPDPAWKNVAALYHQFAPVAGAPPLPYFVDLVTGDVLSIHAAGCFEPVFADPR